MALVLKSFVPHVKTVDDIEELIGYALLYQYMFDRRTSPWEIWEKDELDKFEIDLYKIDRLYSVIHNSYDEYRDGSFFLVARMIYKNMNVFVDFSASCDSSGFDCCGGGEIYVTTDVNLFYNAIAYKLNDNQEGNILTSLLEDGYEITIQPEVTNRISSWHNPSKLVYLCHVFIRNNEERLAHYSNVLPPSLVNSVKDFIKVKKAMDHYDDV